MINFNSLSTSDYRDLRLQIISKVEEAGAPKKQSYIDPKGIPSIGLGMNLRDGSAREAVAEKIFTHSTPIEDNNEDYHKNKIAEIASRTYPKTPAGEAQLQADLNQVMKDRSGDPSATFEFLNDQEIVDTFNTLAIVYENRINSWLTGIPESSERVALFSLSYNGILNSSDKLKAAIQSGNRPESWYQIRYQSNGDHLGGIAKRRYFESQIFGLCDNANSVTEAEAKDVFEMYTAHRAQITQYDSNYGSQIAKANRDYGTDIVTTQDFTTATKPAHDLLVSEYAPGEEIDEILISSNSIHLLKDNGSQKTQNLRVGNSGVRRSIEEAREGENILMIGKSSADVFSFDGLSGEDLISSNSLDGRIKINGVTLSGNAIPAKDSQGNIIPNRWLLNNKFNLAKVDDDLVITDVRHNPADENSPKITIKNFPFSNDLGAFGITLGKGEIIGYQGGTIYLNDKLATQGYYIIPSLTTDSHSSNTPFLVPTEDRRGRFINLISDKRFEETGAVTGFGVAVLDAHCNVISYQPVVDHYSLNEREVSRGYIVKDRSVGIGNAIISPLAEGGHLIAFVAYDRTRNTDPNIQTDYSAAKDEIYWMTIDDDGKILSEPQLVSTTSILSSWWWNGRNLASISSSNGGADIAYYYENSDSTQTVLIPDAELSSQPYPKSFTTSSGSRITANTRSIGFGIQDPIFRNLAQSEVPANRLISDYEVVATDSSQTKQFFACEEGALVLLRITRSSSPGNICVAGFYDAGRVDLAEFPEVDSNYIASSCYTVSAKDFSLDELMSGADHSQRKLQTTDDYGAEEYYQPAEESEEIDEDKADEYTVLPLPDGQRLIFTDIAARNLTQTPENYLVGVHGLNDTVRFNYFVTPSLSPTFLPRPSPYPTISASTSSTRNSTGVLPPPPGDDDKGADYISMANQYGPYAAGGLGGVITLIGAVKFVNWLRRTGTQVGPSGDVEMGSNNNSGGASNNSGR